MHVFYDARWILVEDRFDGVSRYSHELAWAMSKIPDLDLTWIVHDKRQLKKLPEGNHLLVNSPSSPLDELFLPRKLNKAGAKIVYSPFFVMGTLGKKYKLVLTIHDLIYFKYRTPPQWLPWLIRVGWRLFHLTYWPMRWQLNRADHIATVSETAKSELIKVRATARPITPVKNAASQIFNSSPRSHSDSTSVVYTGAFTPYKNVECIIDAVALLPDVKLHICSKIPSGRRSSLESYLKERGVFERTVLHNGVTDEEYRNILTESRCAISASRIEGFGLPLIEAQQAGVPFVAADTDIFREIGDQSVLYFNPDSPEEAAEQIKSLSDTEVNERYSQLGTENSARYTWQKSAEASFNLCKLL